MNRRTLLYLFISLTMVSVVFGSLLPHAAADTSIVPAGLTETFTPVPATDTPVPTDTAVPTETLAPTNTATPAPTSAPEKTNVPAPTNTTVPTPESTPTAPVVVGLPDTGGAAPQGAVSPWILALVVGSLGALAFGLSVRAHQSRRPQGHSAD